MYSRHWTWTLERSEFHQFRTSQTDYQLSAFAMTRHCFSQNHIMNNNACQSYNYIRRNLDKYNKDTKVVKTARYNVMRSEMLLR